MRMSKRMLLVSAFATGMGFVSGQAAAQFHQFYFFGDSLTDAGSFKPILPPGTGEFTTNPGPIWAQALAQRYGSTATPANQGGNDYAVGGARVTQLPGYPDSPPTSAATPVSTQIQTYLAKGPVNPAALYSVWAGANDVFTQLSLASTGAVSPAVAQANVALAATQLVQQVGVLSNSGARYIMVFNLPDIGKTPGGVASGQGSTISALSSFYNSTLNAGLDSLHIDIIKLNIFGLFNEVIANPAAFGFSNATSVACTTSSSLICTSSTLVAPGAAQSYVFADGVHPTTGGHAVIADYAASVLQAPQQMGLMAEAPLQAEQANFRAIDDRMWSGVNASRSQKKFDTYAVYDYGNYDRTNDFGGGNSHLNTLVAGGDMKLSDQLLAGIAFGYTQDKASLGDNAGGFTLNETSLTAYLGYGSGPWYAGATLGGGDLDYRNIRRSFALGQSNRTENGSSNGTHFMGRLIGGYWFNAGGNWLNGPFVRLTYQQAKVYEWSESGTSSTAMSFGQQKRDSFVSSLGWQVNGAIGSVRPFGRITWEKDYNDDNRSVRAGLVSLGGVSFGLPAYQADSDYALFDVGASMPIGSTVTGFIGISATAGKSDGNYQAITVGIRVPI